MAVAALSVLLLVAAIGVFWAYETGRIGSLPHRVEKKVDWGGGCSPEQDKSGPGPGGPTSPAATQSEESSVITCGFAGPTVVYLRFSSPALARRVARESRSGMATCVVGDEVLFDGLDEGFPSLCRDVDGRLVAVRRG